VQIVAREPRKVRVSFHGKQGEINCQNSYRDEVKDDGLNGTSKMHE